MDQSIIFFFAIIIIVGAFLLVVICNTKKGAIRLDVEKYRIKYLAIENQLKRDEASSYYLTVLNADKLVDQALKERGLRGTTMAERMKNFNSHFSDRNGVWLAHKLRNKIAHESDARVTYDEARYALASFKRALKDLGAI
jgi:hypothetical protein